MFPKVVQVIPMKDFSVYVYFEDGKIVCYDMTPMIEKEAFQALKDINVFIDNSINNCLDVLKCNNVDVLLYDTKYNKYCNNLQRVRSWQEIDDFITSKKI